MSMTDLQQTKSHQVLGSCQTGVSVVVGRLEADGCGLRQLKCAAVVAEAKQVPAASELQRCDLRMTWAKDLGKRLLALLKQRVGLTRWVRCWLVASPQLIGQLPGAGQFLLLYGIELNGPLGDPQHD
jgi:hypothetical protein